MINIRTATPDDDVEIGNLLVEAFIAAYANKAPELDVPEWRQAELRDVASRRAHTTIFVAEMDGRTVGTVALFKPGAIDSEAWVPNHADLRHLAPRPELHGQGLSQYLLDHAENFARSIWKCDGIVLHVRRGVHGLARLYEKRGYVREPSGDRTRSNGIYLEAYRLVFHK